MLDFTFLTEEQVFGDNKLDIIRKKGTKCELTDFSIIIGGFGCTCMPNGHRTWCWWTKTPIDCHKHFNTESYKGHGNVRIVDYNGDSAWNYVWFRDVGARPAVAYSSISSFASNKVRGLDGILEVEYGEYPQTVVSEDFAKTLDEAYLNQKICTTGKKYTTDFVDYEYSLDSFKERHHIEYEYQGKKYIRIVGDSKCNGRYLSDGRTIWESRAYWIEVKPIKWIIDEKADIALSKKLLFSRIRFLNSNDDYKGDFNNTYIKQFMDKYFAKEIISNKELKYERHKEIKGKRKGIKVKTISVERIQKMTTGNVIGLKKDNEEERPKVKRR